MPSRNKGNIVEQRRRRLDRIKADPERLARHRERQRRRWLNWYANNREAEAEGQREKRRLRPWVKAEQNRRYLEKLKTDPERLAKRRENVRLWQRRRPPKPRYRPPRKPEEERTEYKCRAARIGIERILSPKPELQFSIINQVKKVPIAISLALPQMILIPIKDALGLQFKPIDYKRRERNRRSYARHREQYRVWDERNKEKRRAMRRLNRAYNRDKRREQDRRYRDRYPDKIRARAREFRIRELAYLQVAKELNLFDPPTTSSEKEH